MNSGTFRIDWSKKEITLTRSAVVSKVTTETAPATMAEKIALVVAEVQKLVKG